MDGVIVTGVATGSAADPAEVRAVSQAVDVTTLVGSGVAPINMASFADADALIVGSSVKQGGLWSNPLDESCVNAVARAFHAA